MHPLTELRYFFTALGYFTRVPVPRWVGYEPHYPHAAARYFPLVGAMVGALGALLLLLALAVPMHLAEGTVTPIYPYLLVAFGFWIGLAIANAMQHPTPKPVQIAVKRCILGLVLLDAILATAFVGPAGLLIGLLLLPANWLGKWVYST